MEIATPDLSFARVPWDVSGNFPMSINLSQYLSPGPGQRDVMTCKGERGGDMMENTVRHVQAHTRYMSLFEIHSRDS